jgi:signal transduction histidine kinase/DNA-binding response OmpR family regulator/HAMP domain-containing protein
VTRVAREVGTEGKLGGQAHVRGVSGTWKDLTDNVNLMAANLTNQVRGIAKVVTAVANGDLERKFTVEAKGEIAALADTINSMIDTLATFADQVTSVAREVGVEGKLGGQASVPGAAGTWKSLTDNVNQLAANLTTQVRAIAEVATAVTTGDLTRMITVEAKGEVAALKDNINEMIVNLKETTEKNSEQDWLKTNLAKFSRMLQGQKDMLTVAKLILSELGPVVAAQHGVFYVVDNSREDALLRLLASYAYRQRKNVGSEFKLGEGLVGQAAIEKEKILLTNVPTDHIRIASGLGEAPPLNILVLPVVFEGQVKAVIELASFSPFSATHEAFLDQLMESVGIVLNTLEANTRTEDLLKQSQSLAAELQIRQRELQRSNADLEDKARLLAEQNAEVERKNEEVEQARQALEEKASQLALTSKYKSEFLANMSHELRTPLNSLLILAEQLATNGEGNLSDRQVDWARTIQSAGNDLLKLINDILDLAKIESGTVTVDTTDLAVADLVDYVERTFRPVAESRGLDFLVEIDTRMPALLQTDSKRLQQVLRNLLSNGFKFTERGQVTLRAGLATEGWDPANAALNAAPSVVVFSVTDTGIGIPFDKHQIIFEAFQQADGSTSRRYGGTGLGLAISREIARVLGGEISLVSIPGKGSTFKLYLPQVAPRPVRAAGPAAGPVAAPQVSHTARPQIEAPEEPAVADDRDDVRPGDRVLLVVEDDPGFARVMADAAHRHGFKALVARRGAESVLLARTHRPHAVTLDVRLPDVDGWRVLRALKSDLTTRHIPVHLISVDEVRQRAVAGGALGAAVKPLSGRDLDATVQRLADCVERRVKTMLLVEDDAAERSRIVEMVGNGDVRTIPVATGAEALDAFSRERIDLGVVDLGLPDMDGVDLIERLRERGDGESCPLVVYTARDLGGADDERVRRLTQAILVKGPRAAEQLFDKTALFLHRAVAAMPEPHRRVLEGLHDQDAVLRGKKVLLVDDDIRNIYAMTSILERHGMSVVSAETGPEAIGILHGLPGIDVVLMDIMLPGMDGYEATRAIRGDAGFATLPIIAVTAKAMRGDREKCLESGASDYLAKPIDTDQLLWLLRVWLS